MMLLDAQLLGEQRLGAQLYIHADDFIAAMVLPSPAAVARQAPRTWAEIVATVHSGEVGN